MSQRSLVWLIGILGGTLVLGFFALLALAGGTVQGHEFAPELFSKREFEYLRVPGFRWRLTATTLTPLTGSLVCSTNISSHLTASTSGTPRWDLLDSKIGGVSQPDGEATILYRYLSDDALSQFWDKWTTENKNMASELWPAVQQLALRHAYFAIPSLMESAKHCTQVEELKSQIQSISQDAAGSLARAYRSRNQNEAANEVLIWGLSLGKNEDLESLQSSHSL